MVSTLAFAFKIIRPIIFSAVKKVSFPQQRNFPTVKELFHNQGIFPQSKNISTVKKLFHNQKGSLKAKILDLFNTKSYAKTFLAL